MTSFRDKAVVVTGASSGIGLAVAEAFHAAGARVLGICRRSMKDYDFSAKKRLCFHYADLLVPGVAADVTAKAIGVLGQIDVLVNAAGVLTFGTVAHTSDEDWARVLRLNLTVPFELMREMTAALYNTFGAVVNVSSINSYRPFEGCAAYNASKAGLDQLTRSAAAEMAPHVRVNAVNPGVVLTDLHRRAGMSAESYDLFMARSEATHPLGVGDVDDVADAVLFLAGHQWITGVTLPVDGGRHLTIVR